MEAQREEARCQIAAGTQSGEINNVVIFFCITSLWNETVESAEEQTEGNQHHNVEPNAAQQVRYVHV